MPRACTRVGDARREPRVELQWESGDDAPCSWVIGDDRPGTSDEETRHGALAPTFVYPLFETALRADAGRGVDEHQKYVSQLWSTFAAVAAGNPNAWSREPWSPEDIQTVTPDNRMVVFPYAKRMCANIDVDQGAAFVMCALETARAAGVADERMIYLHAGAEAHDHWFLTERDDLTRSPGIAATIGDALDGRGDHCRRRGALRPLLVLPVSGADRARRELGLADDDLRPLTVTGGLGFAGGPVNNYPTHAIAQMVEVLRAEPDAYGLTTALGWYVTKHAAGVWSGRPPADGYRRVDPAATQGRVDAQPRRSAAGAIDGSVTLEATAVAFERDGSPASGSRLHASMTDAARSPSVATPTSSGRSPRSRGKAGASASRVVTGSTRSWAELTSRGMADQPSRGRMLRRGLTRRCARCGSGKLFTRWFRMVDDCPRCGLHFEREQGYWSGALAINIMLVGGLFAVVFVAILAFTIPDIPIALTLGICIPIAVFGPIVAYPFSKTIWVAVDRAFLQQMDVNEQRDEQMRKI